MDRTIFKKFYRKISWIMGDILIYFNHFICHIKYDNKSKKEKNK